MNQNTVTPSRPQDALFSEMGIIRNTQQATGIVWLFAVKYDL